MATDEENVGSEKQQIATLFEESLRTVFPNETNVKPLIAACTGKFGDYQWQKEQFSDGVGYSWLDGLKDHANQQVTDAMLLNASFSYPENTPTTKEAYHYRTIFEKFFPKNAARSTVPGGPNVACSTAKAVE